MSDITSKEAKNLQILPSRGAVLSCLEELRAGTLQKLRTGRLKDKELEKARNEKARLLVYICQVMAGILKDQDLDEFKQRIAALEDVKAKDERRRGPSYLAEQDPALPQEGTNE
jgi:hypothetical protein